MNKLTLIKITVGILTFLLIFGLLCAIGLLFSKAKQSSPLPSGDINLEEPVGSRIYKVDHFDNLLYITIKDGGVSDRIIIVDRKQGRKLTSIKLN